MKRTRPLFVKKYVVSLVLPMGEKLSVIESCDSDWFDD